MCAISGLDMALLDLKGKAFQVPCYQLLGGTFRTDLLLYANYWFTGGDHTPQDYARQAERVKRARIYRPEIRPLCSHKLSLWR